MAKLARESAPRAGGPGGAAANQPRTGIARLLFLATAWLLAITVVSGIAWFATRRKQVEEPEGVEIVEPPPARVVRR